MQRLPGGAKVLLRALAVGLLAGSLGPLASTAIYLKLTGQWSLHGAALAHASDPLLWLIDGLALAAAALAGLVYARRLAAGFDETRARQLGFEQLMRTAQHGIVVADSSQAILEWGAGAEDLFGYAAPEIVGRPLTTLIAPHDQASFGAEVKRALGARGDPMRVVLGGLKQDGRHVALEISVAAWPAASGHTLGLVLRDTSKQILAERRLGEVERNWRDIAENSSDVLLLLDRAGTIIFANRGLLGQTVEQLIASNAADVLPHLSDVLEEALASVFEAAEPFEHEGCTRLDEAETWLLCRLAPQREDGEVVRAVLSIGDVTERRSRDSALRRLAAIVERTTDAVLATDTRGRITTWNRGAELLWGWSGAEILGKNLAQLCPPELLDEQRAIFARLQDNRLVTPYDSFALAKNHRRIPVSVTVMSTRNEAGQFEGVSAVVRDTSHHRELREALQRAKSDAEMASQLKSEFLANMSHEVRTPLNGVVGMADLLRSTPLTPEQSDYVATLLEATQALRVIVDDVLDFSKIEAGQLRIENVELDIIALARAAIDMFQRAAQQNHSLLRLATPDRAPERVLGDPNRIRQVLVNLLSNAIKFTRNGSIDVRLAARDDGASRLRLRIDVEDTGVGISPEAQAWIFQPFAQADGSITRRFGGTGLGLAISRKLVELMGGSIAFQSRAGMGSSFWFELTLEKAKGVGSRAGSAQSSLLPKSAHGWRILVAEDNLINQKVVVAMLGGLGARVDVANNGRDAVERWRNGAYDLILMDCQMPVMSGFEAAEAIRAAEQGPRTPIIAMTAQAYARDRERCTLAGMDDHLAKPLTKSELKNTLARWLRLQSMAPLPPALQPAPPSCIDTAALARLQADLGDAGRAMLGGLVETFCDDFEAALPRISGALAAEDWGRIAFEAHRLRSSTSNLAAQELAQLSERLERYGQRSDTAAVTELLQRMGEAFARARTELRAYVQRQAPESSERAREDSYGPAAPPKNSVQR
jgi:PAS domain S-box-containing protein